MRVTMLSVISKKLANYEYSCVLFRMPKTLSKNILAWGRSNISNSDLYTEEAKYGRENEIHVTVKYGLHTADARKIKNLINDFGSFAIALGDVSRFVPDDKDYDVVKINVDSKELSELHRKFGELPNTDEHDIYRAHCTVAYVKKGCCSTLSGNTDLKGKAAKIKNLTFSSHTGEKTEIDL